MRSRFVDAALEYAEKLDVDSPAWCILDYLLEFGLGRENAKPWSAIASHLRAQGCSMSKNSFQNGLLKISRNSNFFIASNDHGVNKGYFLIVEPADAEMMRQWYKKRIASEIANVRKLNRLARDAFKHE